MDISSFASFLASASAPPPGAAKPGDLYADLQSRTLWLGVDPAVDPAGAVLVSDIVALTDAIAESFADSKAYTDTQILTRAPTNHTHTAAQITDFNGAVEGVVMGIPGFNWVAGMILMWSGSLADIGVGDLAGWALCDGSQGTPNLRDRFIIGAGNKTPGSTNPVASFNTGDAGQHTHVINPHVLTYTEMPAHQHSLQVYGGGSFQSGGQSQSHTHALTLNGRNFMELIGGSGGQGTTGGGMGPVANTNWADRDHVHTTSVAFYSTGTSGAAGGGGGHDHTAAQGGVHNHPITSQQLRDALPYYALAFIMKL